MTQAAPVYAVTNLGTFGGIIDFGMGVNAAEQVVRQVSTGGNTRAFLSGPNGAAFQERGTLGGAGSPATVSVQAGELWGAASWQTILRSMHS